jgi:molybdate transport system ATP-binding protein
VRAEDVVLERAPGTPTSARNELLARVRAVSPEGALVRVTLDCGFRLVALVTRESASRLALEPGREAIALVKATSIRLVPRD